MLPGLVIHSPLSTEIGKFLLKKITLRPASYEACVSIIDHYKDNDLYKVVESLDKGARELAEDKVVQNIGELNTVMDNVWKDADKIANKIANKIDATQKKIGIGVDVSIGIAGEVASMSFGGFGPLLAGLGFAVADSALGFTDKLGEKIARAINKSYLVNIYDFKQKYSVA